MATSTKHAALICVVLTVLAAAGAAGAYFLALPVLLVGALLPAAVYELIRTEGRSTKLSSFLISLALAVQIAALVVPIRLDLTSILGSLGAAGSLPASLASLTGILAVVTAVLGVVLFSNTRGVYTRWMAVVVFAGSLGVLFLLAPDAILALLR